MVEKLTAKQEAFAQNIASGMTQADAYKRSYGAEKMSANAIYREASVMLGRPKIAQRVAEIKETLEKKQLWTREMSVKGLVEAYKTAKTGGNASGMTGAIKELNAMHGFNAATEIDHTSGGEPLQPSVIEIVAPKN